MRILIAAILITNAWASIDHGRLESEMEYLRQNAFTSEPLDEVSKAPYFNRSKSAREETPSEIGDLDRMYFSDSVSTNMAAPEKEGKTSQSGEREVLK